jgi:hypothetical protein
MSIYFKPKIIINMGPTDFFSQKSGKFYRQITLMGLMLLFYIQLSAQAGVNFSGTWTLNEAKSKFGNSEFRFAATLLVVNQEANSISDERTQPGFDGNEMKTTQKIALDGTVSESTGFMESKRKSTVTWSADKKSITIATTTVFNMNGDNMEIKSSEIWKLGDDGKSLLIESASTTPDGGEVKNSLFYDKK